MIRLCLPHAQSVGCAAGSGPTCSAQEEPSRTAVAVSPAALLPVPDATTVRTLSCDAYFMSCDLPAKQAVGRDRDRDSASHICLHNGKTFVLIALEIVFKFLTIFKHEI